MMSMLNKILVALLATQVVVVIASQFTRTASARRSAPERLFATLDADKVSKIEIIGTPKNEDSDPDQESIVLEKVNGKWGVASADQYPVNAQKVKDLTEKLEKLRSRTTVLTGSKYHEKLEVSSDKYQRKVNVTTGGETSTFYMGSSPSFKNTHVRVDGSDEVYLVNDFGTSDLGTRAWSWVDRKYHDIPAKDVWALTVKNPKGSFVLEKDPASETWAAVGTTKELDKNTVDDIVRKARSISLEQPVGKGEKSDHGLKAPQATVTLTTGTSTIAGAPPKETRTVTVKIGKKLEKPAQYFVKSSESPYVVRVSEWAVKPLIDKGRADLIKQ